jgi:Zn-dependent protease
VNAGDAAAWYVAFVLSTTAHEAAHGLAAYLGGDRTAYEGGQVSLNPLPHMQREPIGMIVMPLMSAFLYGWSIGWASTPYDPMWEQRYPRRAAWMAAAGPAANLGIAILSLIALRIGLGAGLFYLPEGGLTASFLVGADDPFAQNVGRFLGILLLLNAILFVFNLLPVPPLDGASALGLLLPARQIARFKEALTGGGVASLLFIVIFLFFGRVFVGPIWSAVLRLLYPDLPFS